MLFQLQLITTPPLSKKFIPLALMSPYPNRLASLAALGIFQSE